MPFCYKALILAAEMPLTNNYPWILITHTWIGSTSLVFHHSTFVHSTSLHLLHLLQPVYAIIFACTFSRFFLPVPLNCGENSSFLYPPCPKGKCVKDVSLTAAKVDLFSVRSQY